MHKPLMRCAFLGGIVVFLWGTISWMILPWHHMTMDKFNDEKRVAQVIQDNTPMSGVYVLPCFKHDSMMNQTEARENMMMGKEMMKKGPIVFAVVQKDGMRMGGAAAFILTLIIQIIAAGLITWLLMMTKAMSYMRQVLFITMIGLIAGVIVHLPDMVWSGAPFSFTLVCMLDLVIGWFLGGLVIARVCKK